MLNKPVRGNVDTIPTPLIQDYNDFIANGIFHIFHNREFCHLSISDFFQYLCKTDGGDKLMTGIIRELMTGKIDTFSHIGLNEQKHCLADYLKKFIKENDDRFFAEFLEQLKKQPITISNLID